MKKWIDFKELRGKLDFETILEHYGVEVKRRGEQHHGFCPLPEHNGVRNSPSFSAHLGKGIFHCFGCGAKGNILDFACLMERVNPENGDALRTVAVSLQSRFLPETATATMQRKKVPRAEPAASKQGTVVVNAPLDFELKNLDAGHPYLATRGLSKETIARFGLGFCSRGLLCGRIAIPLHNQDGKLIGYAGRLADDTAIDDEHPKYRFPPPRQREGVVYEFRKSVFVYNGHNIKVPVDDLIVVEGFASVWHLVEQKFENVVALMGSDLSDVQAEIISNFVTQRGRIWLIPDGDAAGERCAKAALLVLCQTHLVQWIKLEPGKQPTDYERGFFEERFSN